MSNPIIVRSVAVRIETEDGEVMEASMENCKVWITESMDWSEIGADGERRPLEQTLKLDAVRDLIMNPVEG